MHLLSRAIKVWTIINYRKLPLYIYRDLDNELWVLCNLTQGSYFWNWCIGTHSLILIFMIQKQYKSSF